MIRAVAFDLDGLMVNTEDIYDDVLDRFLNRRGKSFSLALKLDMMGLIARDAFEVLKTRFQLDENLDDIQAEVETTFGELLPGRIKPTTGLHVLFAVLDGLQIPRAVVTSSPRKLAHLALKSAGIEANFRFVLTGDDVDRGKPDPQIYALAIREFGEDPGQVMALEDSYNGSLAATRSGAFTVVIPGHHSQDQDFSHAHLIARQLDDRRILDLLAKRPTN